MRRFFHYSGIIRPNALQRTVAATATLLLVAFASSCPLFANSFADKDDASTLPRAKSLYAQHLVADQLYSYQGRQVTTYWRTGRSVSVEVYHRAPKYRRIEYIAPDLQRGMVIVSTGGNEWTYQPARKQVIYRRYQMDSNGFDDANLDYDLLERNYEVERSRKSQMFIGRKTAVVSISRKSNGKLARRLWFDVATDLLLKSEHYDDTGKLRVIVAYTEINFRPHFQKGLFDSRKFSGLPGVHVVKAPSSSAQPIPIASVRAQLGGMAVAPHLVMGYQLVAAQLNPSLQGTVIHLTYSDGLNTISLFEKQRMHLKLPTRVLNSTRIRIGNRDGSMMRHAALNTLNWDAGRINWTAMGEVPLTSLVKFADAADDSVH